MFGQDFQIDKTTGKQLKEKLVHHKARFINIFKGRYSELLPSLIKYKNSDMTDVDFLKVEVALRSGYDIIIGETSTRSIQVIGYATSKQSISDPANLWESGELKHGEIHFLIPEILRLPYYKEITYQDECKKGNFVVMRNKTLNYLNDYVILEHYIDELAEIIVSRYSISMQVKISNLFLGEVGDESINQLITDIYNGNPFISGSQLFDPNEQIFQFQNEGLAQVFSELKREYQNKISELNNMLGINSLAIEKESGVSDEETKGNNSYTTSNSNIYLESRNNALTKLNKRYGLQLEAMYNDDVSSEIQAFTKQIEEKEVDNSDNNNIV